MKRALILLLLVACSDDGGAGLAPSHDGPVTYRVLSETQNAGFCREAPDFVVANTEGEWIDVFDVQTECQPGDNVKLPTVDFDTEAGVAAWWRRNGCLGYTIETSAVERKGDDVVVTATSTKPGDLCATAIGQLESFYAFERSERFSGGERIVFMLDGKQAGVIEARARPTPSPT